MNVNIPSQMTQEEIEAYAARMLALAAIDAQKVNPDVASTHRTNIICQVIAACGRPIAKAEQEQLKEAHDAFRAQVRSGAGTADIRPIFKEGAFGFRDGSIQEGDE